MDRHKPRDKLCIYLDAAFAKSWLCTEVVSVKQTGHKYALVIFEAMWSL